MIGTTQLGSSLLDFYFQRFMRLFQEGLPRFRSLISRMTFDTPTN